MIGPPFLKISDKVAIVSPSGKISPIYINNTAEILRKWGLDVEISEHALNEVGSFSGFVEQRLDDLQLAMDDPEIKLIFCSRGGYGAIHLLERLNFDKLRKNPKWMIGFSDITALHSAFQCNGVMSIHAPMAKHFSDEGSSDLSVLYTKTALMGKPLNYNIPIQSTSLKRVGKTTGTLFGGNLSVMTSLIGSKFFKVPHNGILFLEDIGEKPYKVDKMIYQLKISGILNQIKGLIVGQFTDYEEDSNMYASLYESIFSTVKEYSFPICFDFPVGHTKTNLPMIMGGNATLTVGKESISLKQRY
ncbi:MAG TPA: LD-carboxypeptidase [Dysgonamonadaceae bacterium]|nr:LD-carboxypeptidase [Dysgonamonadaceae bacterium]